MRRPECRPARKVERLDARPCLSPEAEAALLDHLMHEEDERYVGPPVESLPLPIVVEPPRGVRLSDALHRTASARIEDRIRTAIRAYPDWSRAELARMDAVVADVTAWCHDGTGGPGCFAAWLWQAYLRDAVEGATR